MFDVQSRKKKGRTHAQTKEKKARELVMMQSMTRDGNMALICERRLDIEEEVARGSLTWVFS